MFKKLLPIIVMFSLIAGGCASLLDPQKDMAIVEDIADDIVKEELGVELSLGPEHQKK